ncbi:hypothetical protein JR316_0011767 [Psilocybe cubensis]|uniref:Uncharacterized protein n=2 Tax=Psilocybe cubensis TaxID=181762 RepID=A0A8H7XLE7_PSICU|nr:hypothetical protein JR316_0011767 [Psilocybe cubensis]KAH9476196.1 hypothetical protein JR316_0011767 [Psilocybe cubensis]
MLILNSNSETATGAQLDLDVIGKIVHYITFFSDREKRTTLRSMSELSRDFRYATKPLLFSSVTWPLSKHQDAGSGYSFPPEILWPYFQTFILDWPDDWRDDSLDIIDKGLLYLTGSHFPKDLVKLEQALPKMENMQTFRITCPFYLPDSLYLAILRSTSIKDLQILDTPFKNGPPPNSVPSNFNVQRLSFTPVGETNRVGEGPVDRRYRNMIYYTRPYRKNYWDHIGDLFHSRSVLGWVRGTIFRLACIETLTYLHVSGRYCWVEDLIELWWPSLETLILTGLESVSYRTSLADIVGSMPKLEDLRVLFNELRPSGARRKLGFKIAPHARHRSRPTIFSTIRHFAASTTACNMDSALQFFYNLESLALIAIAKHPSLPIAYSLEYVDSLLDHMEVTGCSKHLKVLRIMLEDEPSPVLYRRIAVVCPMLESLEVEICGYHARAEEGHIGRWKEYEYAFERYEHIQRLRIAIPFQEAYVYHKDAVDPNDCMKEPRRQLGLHLASRLHTLSSVGFEYRMQVESHKFEDRWLDFSIQRIWDGSIELHELEQSWYPFPEVWTTVPLDD